MPLDECCECELRGRAEQPEAALGEQASDHAWGLLALAGNSALTARLTLVLRLRCLGLDERIGAILHRARRQAD